MAKKKIVLLFVALLVAGTTVLLARSMMTPSGKGTAQAVVENKPVYEVLVAAHDLPAGTLLKELDLKWQTWPVEAGSDKYAVKGKAEMSEYAGTVVRMGLRAGEPLMAGRVVKPGQQGFMAAALTAGMKAVSISLTPVAGVAGFVFPGDRVDVIVTHQIGRKSDIETTARKVSETVLQNVRVLAVDQKMSDQMTEPKIAQIATIEVSGKQAEAVALAGEIGSLSLALRSMTTAGEDDVKPAEIKDGGPEEAKGDTLSIDAAALALPEAAKATGNNVTWDSDVSRVLPRPANRVGAVQKVTIIRGKESSEAVYDLTTP